VRRRSGNWVRPGHVSKRWNCLWRPTDRKDSRGLIGHDSVGPDFSFIARIVPISVTQIRTRQSASLRNPGFKEEAPENSTYGAQNLAQALVEIPKNYSTNALRPKQGLRCYSSTDEWNPQEGLVPEEKPSYPAPTVLASRRDAAFFAPWHTWPKGAPDPLSQMRLLNMEVKLNVLTVLVVALLAGCQTPPTGEPPAPSSPPELTIQLPAAAVHSAAVKTMTDRGYTFTPEGTDTLLFDRTADLGSTLRIAFTDGRAAWRRVRIRLTQTGSNTRVTAEPSLVINRGELHEHEEPDASSSARHAMQEILEKIHREAGL